MSINSSANTSSTEFVDSIIDFEKGILDEQETIEFFQDLIDSGQAWRLQGSYGRAAMAMIRSGQCLLGPVGRRDIYGNYVPSRDEVQPGTPGSQEFVLNSLVS
jgi:hypothetical protein